MGITPLPEAEKKTCGIPVIVLTAKILPRDELPDLVLMDIQLPGMDGLTATRLIKNDDRTKDIPIVALTAFAMDGDKERMMETGRCDAYVSKPIRYKEFPKTVVSILKAGRDG